MDPERQIRFLIPPFYFIAVMFSDWLSSAISAHWQELLGGKFETVAAMAGVVAASLLPLGFLIGALTHFALRYIFSSDKGSHYDTDLEEEELKELLPALGIARTIDQTRSDMRGFLTRKRFQVRGFISTTIDHDLIGDHLKGVHEWLKRTYNGYIVSANSCMAVLLSFFLTTIVVPVTTHGHNWVWIVVVLILAVVLFVNAVLYRRDYLNMQRFQRSRFRT